MGPHHWSKVPEENQTSDPNGYVQKNWPAKAMGPAVRGLMATAACARDDGLGTLVAQLGANNVYAVATNEGLINPLTQVGGLTPAITKPFALRLAFGAALAGSAANTPHLRVDGLDCGPILRRDGTPLADGDLDPVAPVWVLGEFAAATDAKVTRVRVLDLTPSDIAALSPSSAAAAACRLTRVSPTQLALSRCDGATLPIAGVAQTIPADGVVLGNAGVGNLALLFIYAAMSGGTMALEASATPPAPEAGSGLPVKSGDATRTLVGAALTAPDGTFQGGASTLSYFNRRDISTTTGAFTTGTGSGSWTLLQGSVMRGLCWADEAIDAEYTGSGGITAQNAGVYANMRAVVGDAAITTPQIYGPQSRAGGSNFVGGGLASRIVQPLGAVTALGVWAQGFGDAGQQVGYTLSGTLKTRG